MWKIDFSSKNIFIESADKKISYSDFTNQFTTLAAQLDAVQKDQLILIDLTEPVAMITTVFAVLQKKAVPCLLNTYFTQNQIETLLKSNSYSHIISDKTSTDSNFESLIKKNNVNLLKLSNKNEKVCIPDIAYDQKIIFYSSGTLKPKACVLTLENIFFNALGSFKKIPFQAPEKWGLCLPPFHVGGFSIFVRALLNLGTVYLISKEESLLDQIYRVDYVSLVSTQFKRLVEETRKKQKIPILKTILLGGSAIPLSVMKEGVELGFPIRKSYGMTEMGSQIATTDILEPENLESSGAVLQYREIKILNKEICVKGECLFQGYLENNKIQLELDSEGYFHTRDYGFLDRDGRLIVEGRVDRIFQSGGENISPEFIEKIILNLPNVVNCRVEPESDPEYGFRAVAYIECVDSSIEDIRLQVQKILKGFYFPKDFRNYNLITTKSKNWKN